MEIKNEFKEKMRFLNEYSGYTQNYISSSHQPLFARQNSVKRIFVEAWALHRSFIKTQGKFRPQAIRVQPFRNAAFEAMNGLDGIKSVVALQFLLCVAGLFQGIHAGRFLLSIFWVVSSALFLNDMKAIEISQFVLLLSKKPFNYLIVEMTPTKNIYFQKHYSKLNTVPS